MRKVMIFGMFIGMMIARPTNAFFGRKEIEKIKDRLGLKREKPIIENIDPNSGSFGTKVKIVGKKFDLAQMPITTFSPVYFDTGIGGIVGGAYAEIISPRTDTEIVVEAPEGKGKVMVTVGSSNGVPFTYLPPVIKDINPPTGHIGKNVFLSSEVTLTGKNFGFQQPSYRFYVDLSFGISPIHDWDILEWTDNKIIFRTPIDGGIGLNIPPDLSKIVAVTAVILGAVPVTIDIADKIDSVTATAIQIAVNRASKKGREVKVVVKTLAGKSNRKVFTYQLSDESLPMEKTEHPWPMIRHDSQHSGRSPYFGPEKPELKWKIKSSNCNWVAVAKDETIYGEFSAEFGGATKAFGVSADGSLKMRSAVGYGPMGIAETGVIYILGRWNAEFWGIDPKGKIILEREIDISPIPEKVSERNLDSLVIGNDGAIYFVTGSKSAAFLYCLSENGNFNWKLPFTPAEFGDPLPAIDRRDGTIYLVSKERESCFLNAITPDGKPKWRYEISVDDLIDWKIEKEIANLNGKDKSYSVQYRQQRRTFLGEHGFPILAHYDFPQLVIGDDGTIYLVVVGDFLCAISPEGFLRWKKWRIEEGNFSGCSLPAIGLDGTIHISTALISLGKPIRNGIIAFEPNGQFKCSFTEGIKEVRTPLTVDGKGVVYFADAKGIVYAVNSDGRPKWKYHTQPADAYFMGGAMSVGKNKTIYLKGGFNYLGRQHGFLYAIGEAK